MDLLTVKEVAELKGCSVRFIQQIIKSKDLYAQEHINPENNRKQYMIPADTLPDDLRRKYYARQQKDKLSLPVAAPTTAVPCAPSKTYEEMTAEERDQAALWTAVLEEWQKTRARYPRKAEADELFCSMCRLTRPELTVSRDVLYRKWAAYRDGDLGGLLDGRGGWNKGRTGIPKQAWDWFLTAYLDQRQYPISQCYELTKYWCAEYAPELVPELPSARTFRRQIEKQIPRAVETYGRQGGKAYSDRCAPFIVRLYDDLQPNDYWIADNHTLDIISVKLKDGKEIQHRLHLTAFMDARSGVITGWNLTDNPNSQSTILALRHGIMRFGIPRNVYFDNGSEFLTHDLAGRGHRSRKTDNLVNAPPPIIARLGIEMRNAIVRNAKAKPIERTFYTVKMQFSRAFQTFTGGNALERPENHTKMLKKGMAPFDGQLRQIIESYIDGSYNTGAYGGAVNADHDLSRIDVWNEHIVSVRKAAPEELDLMLLRSTRPQKIRRNGVCVNVPGGDKLWYWDENTWQHQEKEVYVRYDPADLQAVRVYDSEDRYMMTLPMARETRVKFAAAPEDVALAMDKVRSVNKAVRNKYRELVSAVPESQRIDILDLQIRKQFAGMAQFNIRMPKQVEIVRAGEKEKTRQAVGQNTAPVDLAAMNRNAEQRRKSPKI